MRAAGGSGDLRRPLGGTWSGQRIPAAPKRTSSGYERVVKPVLDRVLALLLLFALSPVMLVVALLVRVQLGTGLLYRQTRIGHHGRPFQMFKFRTMDQDRRRNGKGRASPDRRSSQDRRSQQDRRQQDVATIGAERRRGAERRSGERRDPEGGRRRVHKSVDDPRHTPLGRFLRASSLDELPQLFNVLRGELSLVGPRPELPEVVENHYQPWQHARHAVKPGITGLWQVTERADEQPMHEHVDTDLRYVHELSVGTDLRILLLTVPVLLGLGGRGQ